MTKPPAPKRIVDLGSQLELWEIHVDSMREQDLNARAMPPAMFDRLQETIKRDGRLESLPLIAQTDKGLEVVSGHHRVRAARAAGRPIIHALVDVSGLTRDQIAAKQLAHNAISGYDDETILAQIFASIADVDARLETFINPDDLKLPAIDPTTLPRIDLSFDFRVVQLAFLPHQHDRFAAAVEAIQAQASPDELVLVDHDLLQWWEALTSRTRREYAVRAGTAIVSKLIDTVLTHYGIDPAKPEDVDPQEAVPLADLLGSALVDADEADVLSRALAKAKASGVTQPLAHWARDYLGEAAPVP